MVATNLIKDMNKLMTYYTPKHHGQFIKESDEWNELRLTFSFKCRIFLTNFLIEANHEYADCLIVNVWKEENAFRTKINRLDASVIQKFAESFQFRNVDCSLPGFDKL
jgi:hypothetical protein